MSNLQVGLDVGGANLKAAAEGQARTLPFALWSEPAALPERLRNLLAGFTFDSLAVTMTGELCDCFTIKRAGVGAILDFVATAFPDVPVGVWSTEGRFVAPQAARADPWLVASANWHALATFAGRLAPEGAALLIDIGSTTTDLIPLYDGRPIPRGLTDPERLACGELVYTGIRRTPVCAVLGREVAAEFFATMQDAYLLLGVLPEAPERCDTADGRPATRPFAHARLARMLCSDVERFSLEEAVRFAERARDAQLNHLTENLAKAVGHLGAPPGRFILSGSGGALGREMLHRNGFSNSTVISLAEHLSENISEAACAYALAILAMEARGVRQV